MSWPDWAKSDDQLAFMEQERQEDTIRAGEEARDRAIEKAERGADPIWLEEAMLAVKAVAYAEPFLTSEMVAEQIDRTTPEPRALGACMRAAATSAWIAPTDRFTPAINPTAHRRPMRVWRSLIYREEVEAA